MSDHDDDLIAAADAVDLEGVRAALACGADVDARGPGDDTALMRSSLRSAIDIMEALVAAGAIVDLTNNLGATALIMACMARGGESVELLLSSGADPDLGDLRAKRPLMWMVDPQFHQRDTSESVGLLVRGGADPNARDEASRSALHWAATGNGGAFDVRPTVLAALVENGADVGATDTHGETPVFGVVRWMIDTLALDAGPRCLQVLLAAGADPHAENNDGQTPLALTGESDALVREALQGLGFER